MRRSTATCAASFWPKKARSGSAAMSSLATTVATPRKWPGRDAPSRRLLKPSTSTNVAAPVGIQLFDRGSEDDVGAFGFGERAVGVEGARIAGEVFVGAELGGVDEDADGDESARFARGANQRGMARVQRAHGGDKADGIAAVVALARATSWRSSATVRRISIRPVQLCPLVQRVAIDDCVGYRRTRTPGSVANACARGFGQV